MVREATVSQCRAMSFVTAIFITLYSAVSFNRILSNNVTILYNNITPNNIINIARNVSFHLSVLLVLQDRFLLNN